MCRPGAGLVVWSLHESAGLAASGLADVFGVTLLVEVSGVHHLVDESVVVVPFKPTRNIGSSPSDNITSVS